MLPTLNKSADALTQSSQTFYLLVGRSVGSSQEQLAKHVSITNVSMKAYFIFKREIFPLYLGLLWQYFEIGNVAQHHGTVCFKIFISVIIFGTIALPLCKVFKGGDKRRRKIKLTKDGRVHNALSFWWLPVLGILFFQSKAIKHNL